MAAMDVHLGPISLDEGATVSKRVADLVVLVTGVRAACRSRRQWGPHKSLTLIGPVGRLQEALDLVNRNVSEPEEPSGGDDDDDDAPGGGGVEAEARPRGARGAGRGGRQL